MNSRHAREHRALGRLSVCLVVVAGTFLLPALSIAGEADPPGALAEGRLLIVWLADSPRSGA